MPRSETPIYNAEPSLALFKHQFSERMRMIEQMTKATEDSLGEFTANSTHEFRTLLENVNFYQSNLSNLKAEIRNSDNEL